MGKCEWNTGLRESYQLAFKIGVFRCCSATSLEGMCNGLCENAHKGLYYSLTLIGIRDVIRTLAMIDLIY